MLAEPLLHFPALQCPANQRVESMKPTLLVLIHLNDASRASVAAAYDVIYAPDPDSRAEAVAAHGATVRAVLTNGTTGLTPAEVDRLPKLELISALGAGYENLPLDHARARNIVLVNGAGTNDNCVADHAFALLLAVVRDVPQLDQATREGAWRDTLPMRPNVSGKRLGILGLGNIGQKMARRGAGFDMELGYHNRKPREGESMRYFESVTALAQWCDFLLIATPGGPGTKHLVDKAVLDALGPDGFVVNVSRGSVVDTEALVLARIAQPRGDAARGRQVAGGHHGLGAELPRQRDAPFCGRAGVDADLSRAAADCRIEERGAARPRSNPRASALAASANNKC
jgi:lactate dehydrogenase-like 2-hydroxyacid dehydrogenase